jgi:hypothetical protein
MSGTAFIEKYEKELRFNTPKIFNFKPNPEDSDIKNLKKYKDDLATYLKDQKKYRDDITVTHDITDKGTVRFNIDHKKQYSYSESSPTQDDSSIYLNTQQRYVDDGGFSTQLTVPYEQSTSYHKCARELRAVNRQLSKLKDYKSQRAKPAPRTKSNLNNKKLRLMRKLEGLKN